MSDQTTSVNGASTLTVETPTLETTLQQKRMALGLIKDCIQIMDEVEAPLGHVNRYLPQQPVQFRELHSEFEKEAMALACDPYNSDDSYWRRVVALRLRAGDAL